MFVLVLVSIATLLTTQVEGHAMFYSVGISGSSDVRGAGKLSTNGVAVFGPFSKASQILCRGEVASAILTPFDLTPTNMTVRVATLADHG